MFRKRGKIGYVWNMCKLTVSFFAILLFAIACSPQKESQLSAQQQVINLLQKQRDQPDSAFVYLDQVKNLLLENLNIADSLHIEYDYIRGYHLNSTGALDSAAHYYQRAIDQVKDTIKHPRVVAYFYYGWDNYYDLRKYGDAIAVTQKFQSLLRKDDYEKWAMVYFMNENVARGTSKYSDFLENNDKRLKMLELSGNSKDVAPALIQRAEFLYYYMKDRDATYKILDSLMLHQEQMNVSVQQQLFEAYGIYEFWEGRYQSSYEHYLMALEATRAFEEGPQKNYSLANTFANIAEVSTIMEDYPTAQAYIDSVTAMGLDRVERDIQSRALKYQLNLASKTENDISKVLSLIDTISVYQDRQYESKFQTELAALTTANENEKILTAQKQQAEIRNLNLRNNLILLGAILVGLTAFGILFYRQRKLRFQTQSLQMQQRLLRSQMNPHYTFNTLYAIQDQVKKDPKQASDYLIKFSRQLRMILENSMRNYVSLEKELETLRSYMELQLIRTPDKFTYQIELDDLEDEDLIFIPPMLLQPFVENSIEHGFASLEQQGHIQIHLKRNDSLIDCRIEDNGRGLDSNSSDEKVSASFQLISDFLKKATKQEVKIVDKASNSSGESGVIVSLSIPYKLTDDD